MTEFKRILVPLDGSSLSERALPVAIAVAQKFGSEIILLRVLDIPMPSPPASHPEVTIGWVREARAHAHQEAQTYLDQRQQEVYEQGIKVRALMRDQSPAEDILQVVVREGIDLIVMSAHGQGGLDRWTFGGVADKVARHSPCPVLLVRYSAPAGMEGGS
jgi:nucleotide-binding universal stress UspA family protein